MTSKRESFWEPERGRAHGGCRHSHRIRCHGRHSSCSRTSRSSSPISPLSDSSSPRGSRRHSNAPLAVTNNTEVLIQQSRPFVSVARTGERWGVHLHLEARHLLGALQAIGSFWGTIRARWQRWARPAAVPVQADSPAPSAILSSPAPSPSTPSLRPTPTAPLAPPAPRDCSICLSEASTHAFCCGHCCVCKTCADRIIGAKTGCPLCRQPGLPFRIHFS